MARLRRKAAIKEGCIFCNPPAKKRKILNDEICYIIMCAKCKCPMIVYKGHGTEMSIEEETHMRDVCNGHAFQFFGDKYWKLIPDNRHDPDHIHWHMRLVNSERIKRGVKVEVI
jgi:hypothetical protein